jgi:hypothetical protein
MPAAASSAAISRDLQQDIGKPFRRIDHYVVTRGGSFDRAPRLVGLALRQRLLEGRIRIFRGAELGLLGDRRPAPRFPCNPDRDQGSHGWKANGRAWIMASTWSSWHVATAAEAFAAAQFARYGYDVSVQYGANQPEYDLMIASGGRILKVSVKGSADGGWGLSQTQLSKLRNANYHGAAELWLERHKPLTALCLVQFRGVADDDMPRIYLAWPKEIADRLKAASGGRGDTLLWENYTRGPRAAGAGTIERIPENWKMTRSRVHELVEATVPLDEKI